MEPETGLHRLCVAVHGVSMEMSRLQVTVLSEGYQLYFGRPEDALYWFGTGLGFTYNLERDGAVSDWLMDLVSVGFQKPESFTCRSMCTVEDVIMAYHAFQVLPCFLSSSSSPPSPAILALLVLSFLSISPSFLRPASTSCPPPPPAQLPPALRPASSSLTDRHTATVHARTHEDPSARLRTRPDRFGAAPEMAGSTLRGRRTEWENCGQRVGHA